MLITQAYAQTAAAPAGAPQPTAGDMAMSFLPLILIFVVFYFLLIRPQQKRLKEHQEMLNSLRRGDKVVTGGGIIGAITKLDGNDDLLVEIAQGVVVKIQRATIASKVTSTEPAKGDDSKSAA